MNCLPAFTQAPDTRSQTLVCSALNTLDNPSSLDSGTGRLSFRVASSLLPALASSSAADSKQTLGLKESRLSMHARVYFFIICTQMSATHKCSQLIIILTAPEMGRVDSSPIGSRPCSAWGPVGGTASLPPGSGVWAPPDEADNTLGGGGGGGRANWAGSGRTRVSLGQVWQPGRV